MPAQKPWPRDTEGESDVGRRGGGFFGAGDSISGTAEKIGRKTPFFKRLFAES